MAPRSTMKAAKADEENFKEPDIISLQCVAGPCKGAVFSKQMKKLTIGRTARSLIHLKDDEVSQKHAEIRWNGDAWEVEDVGSSNGTKLNGQKLEEGAPVVLKNGDLLVFGCSSTVQVDVRPVPDENITVEQFLTQECDRLVTKIKNQSELLCQQLLQETTNIKSNLIRMR